MLHTADSTRTSQEAGASRVRCRARTWLVAARRHEARGTQWHLTRADDPVRLIASPPDDVTPLPHARRRCSRRALLLDMHVAARSAAPPWWPRHVGGLPIEPQPWQLVPAMAVLSGHHRRLLLADEIGLGKTIAAGVLLREVHARDLEAATLVVVPAGLVRQWLDELRTRLAVDARVLDAEVFRREAAHPRRLVDAGRAGGCWVVSLDLLRQPDVPCLLTRTRWTQLVVDEAHLAAPGSARLEAVARVAAVSERVLLLTGTPAAAGLHGADTLRQLGRHDGEPPMTVLCRSSRGLTRPGCRTRVLAVDLGQAHRTLMTRLEHFAARARHERGSDGLLPALVLQKRALSCPAAVARSIARRLEVLGTEPEPRQPSLLIEAADDPDDGDEDALRAPAWQDDCAERDELQVLRGLAEALPPAGRKLTAVARLIRRAREPVVVFTAYVDTLRELRRVLAGREVVVVHGQQPEALRRDALQAFTSGAIDVLLTTDASAEGLNLQGRCRLVLHAEVPPSARLLLQRTGRVDRFGQVRRVHSVVMASAATGDREALARLTEAREASEAWLPTTGALTCRRTQLAVRVAARSRGTAAPVAEARPRLVSVPPRRWRRLCARVGVPATSGTLWWGRLRADGVALAETSVAVVIASRDTTPVPPSGSIEDWRRVLPVAVGRAERLARRLVAWRARAEAAVMAAVIADTTAPRLFDDALGAPADPPRVSSPALAVTFLPDGTLERRP